MGERGCYFAYLRKAFPEKVMTEPGLAGGCRSSLREAKVRAFQASGPACTYKGAEA